MIWVIILGFVCGLAVRAAWDLIKYLIRRNKTPKVKVEKYGHRHDPVADIRAGMPPLDWPYAWESWVEDGEWPMFQMRIVDLSQDCEPVNGTYQYVHLVKHPYSSTWAEHYQRYSSIVNEQYQNKFLAPAIKKAESSKRKVTPIDDSAGKKNYQLG